MSTIQIYRSNRDLPAHLEWQIRDFIRIAWYDAFKFGYLDSPVLPDIWHPIYVVMTEQQALISHAAVVWHQADYFGVSYKTYGFSSVFTYPAFRKEGHGRQVVQAANRLIDEDPEADIAFLFTDPGREAFYGLNGWEVMQGMTILKGDKNAPQVYETFPMMRFLSEKGRQGRPTFVNNRVYFAPYTW